METVDVIVTGIVFPIVGWCMFIGFDLLKIWANGSKRAKDRVYAEYPYYTQPLYKKILFLGLKDAVPKSFIISVYIFHFLTFFAIGVSIVYLIIPLAILYRFTIIVNGGWCAGTPIHYIISVSMTVNIR